MRLFKHLIQVTKINENVFWSFFNENRNMFLLTRGVQIVQIKIAESQLQIFAQTATGFPQKIIADKHVFDKEVSHQY